MKGFLPKAKFYNCKNHQATFLVVFLLKYVEVPIDYMVRKL